MYDDVTLTHKFTAVWDDNSAEYSCSAVNTEFGEGDKAADVTLQVNRNRFWFYYLKLTIENLNVLYTTAFV